MIKVRKTSNKRYLGKPRCFGCGREQDRHVLIINKVDALGFPLCKFCRKSLARQLTKES